MCTLPNSIRSAHSSLDQPIYCIIMYFPILLLDAKLYKFHVILPAYQYIGHKVHHCNACYPIEPRVARESAC